jgi:flagellar protein FliJ
VKRYRFRLEQVLRIRRLQEELARGELLGANREVARAGEMLAQRSDRYGTIQSTAHTLPAADFMMARERHEAAAAAVIHAAELRAAAERTADERRSEWSEAATRVRVLERLDERRRTEHAAESARADEMEVDDLVTGRFGRDL